MPVIESISELHSNPLLLSCNLSMSASRSSISMRIALSPALRYPDIVSTPLKPKEVLGTVTSPGGGALGNSCIFFANDHKTNLNLVGAGFSSNGIKIVCWPKRTPCFLKVALASWSSDFTVSITVSLGTNPKFSTKVNAKPRARPVSLSSLSNASSGSNKVAILRSIKC